MSEFNCNVNQRLCDKSDNETCVGFRNESQYKITTAKCQLFPSISSNGYYGYSPVLPGDPNAMEIDDSRSACAENTLYGNCSNPTNISQNELQRVPSHASNESISSPHGRKRTLDEESYEIRKKMKKEVPSDVGSAACQVSVQPPNHFTDSYYPRCNMGHYV